MAENNASGEGAPFTFLPLTGSELFLVRGECSNALPFKEIFSSWGVEDLLLAEGVKGRSENKRLLSRLGRRSRGLVGVDIFRLWYC